MESTLQSTLESIRPLPPLPASSSFTPQLDSGLLDRILAPGALTTVFQPIFELLSPTPKAIAVECLTRGPKGSSLEAPDVLFGFARRKHSEAVVDRAAIATAFASAAPLPDTLPLHVNVHASTLSSDHTFPTYLEKLASSRGIAMSRLTVEIVEHAGLASDATLVASLDALRARGVGIALDDIGHGRTNFRIMLLARPGMLKVDRYLIQGIAGDPIRQAVLTKLREVALAIPAVIVAEGIETLEDLETLRSLGIEAGQGYLFGRPVPAKELTQLSFLRQYDLRAGACRPLPPTL